MPYFPQHRILFIHIPKNAGKAIESALNIKFQGNHSLLGTRSLPNRFFKLLLDKTSSKEAKQLLHGTLDVSLPAQHLTLNEIELLTPSLSYNSQSRKFAVLRNPFDRAVSIFIHLRTHKEEINVQNFDKFLKSWGASTKEENIIKRPQSLYITNSSGAVGIDKVLRFEELENDFNNLLAEWDINASPLRQLGGKVSDDIRSELLVNSTKKRIEMIYAHDFEIWERFQQT